MKINENIDIQAFNNTTDKLWNEIWIHLDNQAFNHICLSVWDQTEDSFE